MNTEELTSLANVHQSILTRHDQEIADIRATLQQSETQHKQSETRHAAHVAKMETLQALNQEQLNQLTAGLLDLRNQVADFVKSREQPK